MARPSGTAGGITGLTKIPSSWRRIRHRESCEFTADKNRKDRRLGVAGLVPHVFQLLLHIGGVFPELFASFGFAVDDLQGRDERPLQMQEAERPRRSGCVRDV